MDINWLSEIKYQMAKKEWMKINNIILKRIKEYLKVTHRKEKWVWAINGI